MNYNPLPIEVNVIETFELEGRGYQPGERATIPWRQCKQLEKQGIVERVLETPINAEPIRDVLIFTPVLRLEPETVKALMAQEFEGAVSLLFQRDNPTPIPTPIPGPSPIERANGGREDGKEVGRQNHLHQYRRGRETFLAGKWDAMMVVESDIIPPPDALKRLAALGVDCAYGVYRFRKSDVVNIFERYPEVDGRPPRNVGESLSFKPHILKWARSVGRFPCSGGGLGIILIRRKVLEAIDFRMERTAHCDTWFTTDVLRAGFTMAAEMNVVCGHKNEEGEVLWPKL